VPVWHDPIVRVRLGSPFRFPLLTVVHSLDAFSLAKEFYAQNSFVFSFFVGRGPF